MNAAEIDFRILFEASPDVLLVLRPDAPKYTMVAATRARLEATHTTREQILGRGLFELFPDNPEDPTATGTANLRASLDRVTATKAPDTMAVQKYDIRGPDGNFEVKYWSPKNIPVLAPSGELLYIIHRVEDVTDLVRASEIGDELRDRTMQMEREVIARSRELATANDKLRAANVKLGELDAAKTAFFSNISHEFRTPLTLMLGPIEEGLADREEPPTPRQRSRLTLAHDNALRLLKLVNALLDFSRLEAGRLKAAYAPVDIAGLTSELAGMFQSAAETAGLRLVIDCPVLSEPAFVDRDMWEKIVPNLVSNALKFTLEGEIVVRMREEASKFVLEVADTGVGIPANELTRIFDRFHRVEGAGGRTQEGSGIGLSLVRELVAFHGGAVSVDSQVGRGSTFRVEVPKGFDHLPPDALSKTPADPSVRRGVAAYAAEAARWVGSKAEDGDPPGSAPKSGPSNARPRILVVDDNADLRDYIAGLLTPSYHVSTACDGRAALEAMRTRAPDIVVSDVMMPNIDGFGLVRELRADPCTASIPVILLSARAGEESAIEGLDSGADDYLVKPFSARELVARVRTHVELARARREWIAELERVNRDLDAFNYSVSHDLRAPLRAIEGFSRALAEDYAALLDAQGHEFIERICRSVDRMSNLIDAMLSLASIARAPLVRGGVNLSTVAAGIVADLRRAEPDATVDVDIEADLLAQADPALLNVVLVNLIGNAWKFTSKCDIRRILVGRHPNEPDTFLVRDNGAGFDTARARRLFEPFVRFHTTSEFEGTGIGLANVRRAIERHGGRIWAESEVERGATFFFSLPAETPLSPP
ncbi:MAG TPA: ATP-binding protein [Labilithrix sp.]|nr:ATP-binding protein [Labilithrix sp.]